MQTFQVLPAGDSAILVKLGDEINPATSRRVHWLADRLQEHPLPGLGEAIPGYASLLIHFNPMAFSTDQASHWIEQLAANLPDDFPGTSLGRLLEIPTVYDGPDLPTLAASKNLGVEDVIRLHANREYLVYMIGFTPGFAYLGEVDERIAAPRLATPRQRVSAGSIGIAGRQTGVYPIDSPGGWQLIGRTNLRFFDSLANPPCLLAPGDRVIFCPVEALP